MSRIGFVGAGRMGAPMVRRLVEAGHEVYALGRTPDKREAVAALGAHPVAEAVAAARDADAVLVCVFTDEQVRRVCLDDGLAAAVPSGSALVLHTTGSPRTAEAVAAAAEPRGVAVLDAPVSGGPHDIAAGRVTLFVGGSDAAFARVRPLLAAYGDPVLHVGRLGDGQRVKLVNNTMFAAQIGLVAAGLRLGERLGLDEATLLEALPQGSAASRALTSIAMAGSAAAFMGAVAEFIGKDVEVVRRTAAELGTDLGVLDALVDAARPGGRHPA
ncbi:NAD(P)-dependent oxidoreductase [uncultured Mycolicibacterium sp.]|uniref:NAD(P)-dependent oxidoreductase n=1 Tax=uncultured Mycolicibacterium sp. TaxID=2320817 RepID=UPI00262A7E2E|nr:NAD(P)-dependent oxidoreductase [uncultured Mycolicibacterium sp.]